MRVSDTFGWTGTQQNMLELTSVGRNSKQIDIIGLLLLYDPLGRITIGHVCLAFDTIWNVVIDILL